jgi:hypothetical protein
MSLGFPWGRTGSWLRAQAKQTGRGPFLWLSLLLRNPVRSAVFFRAFQQTLNHPPQAVLRGRR